MVVLEEGGMMTANPNQYLQPDYLSPMPSSLDAKKSPLALLAQTCSQIGADTSPAKPLLPPLDKKKTVNSVSSDTATRSSPTMHKADKPRTSPEIKHLAFKPYETNVVTKKVEEPRPSSKSSSDGSDDKRSGKSTPGRKSTPPGNDTATPPGKASPVDRKSGGSSGTSPIVRSGLEVLGHGKDPLAAFKGLPGLPAYGPLAALCCPPGADNPAFRPPYAGAPLSAHHAAMLAAAAFPAGSPNPYVAYARVKTPAGGEAVLPVCKDPYCAGCQLSAANHALVGGACPAGCTQCEHQKYAMAYGRPYVCSWIAGDAYCGKRFGTSEELLQHLRSHTAAAEGASPLLGPLLRGSYPAAPLSPLSAARYHPYSKLPALSAANPYAFNPAAALGPFYSPYAVYGQRPAVHQ